MGRAGRASETAIIRASFPLQERARRRAEEDMSGTHHDPIEDNIETHPVKLAVGIAVGAVALVIGIVLLAQLAVAMYGARPMKDDAAMSDAAVAKRLAPVAKLAVD